MVDLRLVFPSEEYRKEWYNIIREIENAGEEMTPYALKGETDDYDIYLANAKSNSIGIHIPEGRVPADILFLVCNGDNRILGSIDIRYELNDYLYNYGGNIGYGIRPTERRKGYATEMLRMALDLCKEKGMNKIPKEEWFEGNGLSYLQAAFLTAYLIDNYSLDQFLEFCIGTMGGKSFEKVFGITYNEAKNNWLEYLNRP